MKTLKHILAVLYSAALMIGTSSPAAESPNVLFISLDDMNDWLARYGDLHDVPPPGRELATRPWNSGTHKTVAANGAWREATHAYPATVFFADALVGRVIEALDKGPHADNTWIILWSDHGWSLGEKEHWGKHVPWPLAEMSGVGAGNVLYLFSGRTAEGTTRRAFRLDLDADSPAWEEIPWPAKARGRMNSVAGVHDGKIYLFAGRDVMSKEEMEHTEDRMEVHSLDFLRDSWRLDPETLEWSRLADLPHGLSAAPANTVPSGGTEMLVLGDVNVGFLKEQNTARPELNGQGHDHPGFPRTIWAYYTEADFWIEAGEFPAEFSAPVTVPVVPTGVDTFIIPSGEIKLGVRTTQVISGEVKTRRTP